MIVASRERCLTPDNVAPSKFSSFFQEPPSHMRLVCGRHLVEELDYRSIVIGDLPRNDAIIRPNLFKHVAEKINPKNVNFSLVG